MYFNVPNRFAASFTVLGGTMNDPWWCADAEFLFEIKGERNIAIRECCSGCSSFVGTEQLS